MYKSEYSLTWIIKNFSFCPKNNKERLGNFLFLSKSFGNLQGCLNLYPRGRSEEYADLISYDLYMNTKECPTFQFDCEIIVIGASGKILKIQKWTDISGKTEYDGVECAGFITIEEAVDDAKGSTEDKLTICCKLSRKNSNKNILEETFMCTKIGVDCHNFSLEVLRGKTKNIIIPSGTNKKFELSITDSRDSLKITVSELDSKRDEGCFVHCNLIWLKFWANDIYCVNKKHYFPPGGRSIWKFPSISLSNEVRSYCKEINYPLESIDFLCEFSSSSGTEIRYFPNKTETSSASTSVVLYPSLKEDFGLLFQSKKHCDVKLLVDSETIETHKTVLAARSPVFDAMFNHSEMKESRSDIVKIDDIDIHTLKLFLQFLYTDTVDELNYEAASDLIMAAKKYQVLRLKEMCSLFLKAKMSVENVCAMLSLADTVNHDNLKSSCIEFIIENSTIILSSPQWITWMKNNMELATHIFSKLTKNHSIRK